MVYHSKQPRRDRNYQFTVTVRGWGHQVRTPAHLAHHFGGYSTTNPLLFIDMQYRKSAGNRTPHIYKASSTSPTPSSSARSNSGTSDSTSSAAATSTSPFNTVLTPISEEDESGFEASSFPMTIWSLSQKIDFTNGNGIYWRSSAELRTRAEWYGIPIPREEAEKRKSADEYYPKTEPHFFSPVRRVKICCTKSSSPGQRRDS